MPAVAVCLRLLLAALTLSTASKASTQPEVLDVMSRFVRQARVVVLVVLNTPSDFKHAVVTQLRLQRSVPVLLSRVDTEGGHLDTSSDSCQHYTDSSVTYIIVEENTQTLLEHWDRVQRAQFVWNREATFLVLVKSLGTGSDAVNHQSFLEMMWKKYGILNVFLVPISVEMKLKPISKKVMFYHPFARRSNGTYGVVQMIDASNISSVNEEASGRLHNLNGYSFHVSMFATFKARNKSTNITEAHYGLDGYVLRALERYMGFTAVIHNPAEPKDYGFVYPNGSATGTLGAVVSGAAEIALNARFVKTYGTNCTVFMKTIFSDDLCIVVPKAKLVPKWLMMVMSFDRFIYFLIFLAYFLTAALWFVFRTMRRRFDPRDHQRRDAVTLLLDTMGPYVNTSSSHVPRASSERVLFTCGLILGLILVSAFQGQLVTAISHPTYYQDINTLQQLDTSGLVITTSSRNMHDSFADTGNPVLDHLRDKIAVVRDGFGLDRVARRMNIAAFARRSEVDSQKNDFQNPDGTKLLHLVKDCPRSYYLSYVMLKSSPYSSKVNGFLSSIFESGSVAHMKTLANYDFINMKRTSNLKPVGQANSKKVFTLVDLQLPFLILGSGLGVAWIVFLQETLTGSKLNHSRPAGSRVSHTQPNNLPRLRL